MIHLRVTGREDCSESAMSILLKDNIVFGGSFKSSGDVLRHRSLGSFFLENLRSQNENVLYVSGLNETAVKYQSP